MEINNIDYRIWDVFYIDNQKKVVWTNRKGKLIIMDYPIRYF